MPDTGPAPTSEALGIESAPDVRPVTDTEVAFFQENGWVYLPRLVDPELCREALEEAKRRMASLVAGEQAESLHERRNVIRIAGTEEGTVADIMIWAEWRGGTRAARHPILSRITAGRQTSQNVRRLFRRDKPVRIFHDILTCKLPNEGSVRTGWHQDNTNFPLDRNALTIWVALDEITPDMGPVLHLSGSHRLGMLGDVPKSGMELTEEYPELARLPVSPPNHMQAGDATVHHGLTVHSANANTTPRPRWAYFTAYVPADARYNGAPNHDADGFDLRPGETLDHPSFTLLPD